MTPRDDRAGASIVRPSIVRLANDSDRPALVALEAASFAHDRITPRSWRRLLARPSALILVAGNTPGSAASHRPHANIPDQGIAGALVLLFRRGSRVARVYSLAVAAADRGRGIARMLLDQAASAATARNCRTVRLETRLDNTAAQSLFHREGFAVTGRTDAYYEDGMAALRLERPLPLAHSR